MAVIKLPGKGIWQELLQFLTSLLMNLHTAASYPHQMQMLESWEMIVHIWTCQIPSRIAPPMHHIRVLYPCFEGIASLKSLWFKARDEFTPVAQSWPSLSAEADILYTSWCLPKAVRVARTSLIILHDIPTLHIHCAPFNWHMWSLAQSWVLSDSFFRYF